MNARTPNFEARELRQVLGAFVTGVTVITALDENGKPHGLTANSFSSVSLDPPLILWSQSLTAPSHPVFRDAERFVVNILADDQVDVSNRFARGGVDKFAGLQTQPGLGGVPLLTGCTAYLECRRINSFPGGDHVVFLGEVERIERSGRPALVFGGGRYLVAQPHDMGPLQAQAGLNVARLQAVRMATRALADLSAQLDQTLGLGVWGNMGPTIVRWEASSQAISENLGTGLVLPVLTSATGLAFASWLPPEVTASFIASEMAADAAAPAFADAPRPGEATGAVPRRRHRQPGRHRRLRRPLRRQHQRAERAGLRRIGRDGAGPDRHRRGRQAGHQRRRPAGDPTSAVRRHAEPAPGGSTAGNGDRRPARRQLADPAYPQRRALALGVSAALGAFGATSASGANCARSCG